MKDNKTLAYINLFAILGAIPMLCELSDEAQKLIKNDKVSIGFAVKDGPSATLIFDSGKATMVEGVAQCNIKLPFSSPEKFNGMIDGVVTPFPSKGFTKISFLLKKFSPLTDILSKYLRATDEDMKDENFARISTLLMFRVITEAMSQIGNHDKIGSFTASNIVDGSAKLSIGDDIEASIVCVDHKLHTVQGKTDECTAYMAFSNLTDARAIFDGKLNALAAVGLGKVRVGGMISMIDNLNRILDRVSFYLA